MINYQLSTIYFLSSWLFVGSAWEAAHRMLVEWKTKINDSAIQWQLLINMLKHVLPSDDMQQVYSKLMDLSNQQNVLPQSVDWEWLVPSCN